MMGQPQALCEEDEIINRLRESRSDGEMFFDVEFGGVATALYENESEVPEYDQDLSEPVVWLRPQELAHSPEYFVDGALSGSVVEGRLGDGWLLGAMAAISGHPELLVENLFGSDPDDFKKWGVYTCRFYKNGSWVEVTTDTRAPATSGFGDGGAHGSPEPIYGRCLDPREQWVSLLEKAYAKLHGSYEALSGGSVTEALVDLTGGSGEDGWPASLGDAGPPICSAPESPTPDFETDRGRDVDRSREEHRKWPPRSQRPRLQRRRRGARVPAAAARVEAATLRVVRGAGLGLVVALRRAGELRL